MIWGNDKVNIKKLNIGIPNKQEYSIYAISYGDSLIIIPIAEYIVKHNNADGFYFLSLRRRYYSDKYSNIQHIDGLYDNITEYIQKNTDDIIAIARDFGIYDEDKISVHIVDKYNNQLTKFNLTEVKPVCKS